MDGDAHSLREFLRAEPLFADNRLKCALRQLAFAEAGVRTFVQTLDRIASPAWQSLSAGSGRR